jgi:hypothetical protein
LPTHEELPRFPRDWQALRPAQKAEFLAALRLFLAGLSGQRFDPRLRVKRIRGHSGIWEVSWAADGRATFEYGGEVVAGEPHIIWRRIGTHDVFAPRDAVPAARPTSRDRGLPMTRLSPSLIRKARGIQHPRSPCLCYRRHMLRLITKCPRQDLNLRPSD